MEVVASGEGNKKKRVFFKQFQHGVSNFRLKVRQDSTSQEPLRQDERTSLELYPCKE